MSRLKQIKQALIIYYTASPKRVFKQFRDGVIYFAVGLLSIYMAHSNLPSSLTQELIVLAGLALTALGFVMALLAETRLIIGRFVRFARRKD